MSDENGGFASATCCVSAHGEGNDSFPLEDSGWVPLNSSDAKKASSSTRDHFPRTRAEAKEHIQQIRTKKGLDRDGTLGPDDNREDLEEALKKLSHDLYHKPTHFLMELVQNADDSAYRACTPALNITYKHNLLRINSNETGFTRGNVEAICRIGRSYKANPGISRGYIGENGIGFKSVFKVAHVVWIISGHYSFKFDTTSGQLGMIAPIWVDELTFGEALPGFTSIILDLSPRCKPETLIRELKLMDPKLLIFLHNIREIGITVKYDASKLRNFLGPERLEADWTTTLTRVGSKEEHGSAQHVVLTQHHSPQSFLVFRYQVATLPTDPKRLGCTQSDILLAFPDAMSESDSCQTENMYAFLPIRNYGFKFVIHADFLLIANREDIDFSSTWNQILAKGIPSAFLHAVNEFNKGEFRYIWSRFLSKSSEVNESVRDIQTHMLELLSQQPILESQKGNLMAPIHLVYCHSKFLDSQGIPLIPLGDQKLNYLSRRYPSDQKDVLFQLGVTSLADDLFLKFLSDFTIKTPLEFQKMPGPWHSRLSKVLYALALSSKKYKIAISQLKIAPLRDGTWIAPTGSIEDKLFFPLASGQFSIPGSLLIYELHQDVYEDTDRRQLVRLFGTKECVPDTISDIILKTHGQPTFAPDQVPLKDLVSHVMFLYNFRNNVPANSNIWFRAQNENCQLGRNIYLESELPHSAASTFKDYKSKVNFLHGHYYKAFSNSSGWGLWLQNTLNLAVIPRLVVPDFSGSLSGFFSMSADFRHLKDNMSSPDLLLLLRHHWQTHYRQWFVSDPVQTEKGPTTQEQSFRKGCQDRLRFEFAKMQVLCYGGVKHPLDETFLPRKIILRDHGIIANTDSSFSQRVHQLNNLCLLDISDPEHIDWDFLEHFDVAVKLEARTFITRLLEHSEKQVSLEYVTKQYNQLQVCAKESSKDLGHIRRLFQEHNLVYSPLSIAKRSSHWIGLRDCVWRGPEYLEVTLSLVEHYPNLQWFFCHVLEVHDADLETIIIEAQKLSVSDSLDYITRILIDINNYLSHKGSIDSTPSNATLQALKIFPLRTGSCRSGFDILSASQKEDEWFLPDVKHLAESFEGKCSLLAFDPKSLEQITPLLDRLGLLERRLSKQIHTILLASPPFRSVVPVYANNFHRKIRWISRLIPVKHANRHILLEQLQNCHLIQAKTICIHSWIMSMGKSIYGRQELGKAKIDLADGRVNIYLTHEEIDDLVPSPEFADELVKAFGILPEHAGLLSPILMLEDLSKIESYLQRKGITDDLPFKSEDTGPENVPEELELATTRLASPAPQNEKIERKKVPSAFMQMYGGEKSKKQKEYSTFPQLQGMEKFEAKKKNYSRISQTHSYENERSKASRTDPWTDHSMPSRAEMWSNVKPRSKPLPSSPSQSLWTIEGTDLGQGPKDVAFQSASAASNRTVQGYRSAATPQLDTVTKSALDRRLCVMVSLANQFASTPESPLGLASNEIQNDLDSKIPKVVSDPYVYPKKEEGNKITYMTPKMPATFQAISNTIIPLSSARNILGSSSEREAKFRGQLCVSRALEKLMGDDYSPQIHWTSDLRSQAGEPHYRSGNFNTSTFTIADSTGRFTGLLVKLGFHEAAGYGENPTYHLEVCVSNGDLQSLFYLDSNQARKAKKLSASQSHSSFSREVFILTRVYNISTEPGIAFIVDPWKLQATGHLSLEPYGRYEARISATAPVISIVDPSDLKELQTNEDAYVYERLSSSQIRLIKLFADEEHQPLRGEIFRTSITDAPPFWALSYVWGAAPTLLDADYFNVSNKRLMITPSLHNVLKSIRKRGVSILLWADALCINQTDSAERIIQIRLLRTVYERADQVIAWIGDERCSSHRVLGSLEKLGKRAKSLVNYSFSNNTCQDAKFSNDSFLHGALPIHEITLVQEHVDELLERPWFSRIWIVQELVLPSKVTIYCGRSELLWEDFANGLDAFERVSNSSSSHHEKRMLVNAGSIFALRQTRRRFHEERAKYKLLDLLELFSYTEATFKRDKLFALLGLATDSNRKVFDPDYRSTDQEVVRRFAMGFVENRQVMELLYKAGKCKRSDISSWIPGWTGTQGAQTISNWENTGRPFSAGRSVFPTARVVGADHARLQIKGSLVDEVREVPNRKIGSNIALFVEDLRTLISYFKNYPTHETVEELMLRIPIGNAARPHLDWQTEQQLSYRTEQTLREDLWPANLGDIISSVSSDQDVTKQNEKPVEMQALIFKYWRTVSAFLDRLSDGKFCITKKLYAGMVPSEAMAGDKIVVFDGGKVPFVLRERYEERNTWTLVGECYIHGIMSPDPAVFEKMTVESFAII